MTEMDMRAAAAVANPALLTDEERAIVDAMVVADGPIDEGSLFERRAALRTPSDPMVGVMDLRRFAAFLADPRSAAFRARRRAVDATRDAERVATNVEGARVDLLRRLDDAGVPRNALVRRGAIERLGGPAWDAVEALLRWHAARCAAVRGEHPAMLVLAGDTGNGKTTAAVRAIAQWPGQAEFVTAEQIGRTPRNGFSDNRRAWDRWMASRLLVVDDLGAAGLDAQTFALLMRERWNDAGVTIITTNLDIRGATVFLHDRRLADRVIGDQADRGLPWFMPIQAPSFRTGGAK